MNRYALLDSELSKPENEPLRWLLRDILLAGASNFLSEMIVARQRTTIWNRMIERYRSLLINPDEAPQKVAKEVNLNAPIRERCDGRLNDLYAEILAVVTLAEQGYRDFEVVVEQEKAPDFRARKGGASALIEVKNLREPEDLINVAVSRRWTRLRAEKPHRYNFPVQVYHSHQRPVSKPALKQLLTLLDQLPDRSSDRIQQELDGGIVIRIQKGDADWVPAPEFDCGVSGQRTVRESENRAQMVIRSPLRLEDFQFRPEDFQQFFLKGLRVTAEATGQLFSRSISHPGDNIVALRWEAPYGMYYEVFLNEPKRMIEALFQEAGLRLELLILIDNNPLRVR
jgi:hypothetical protein